MSFLQKLKGLSLKNVAMSVWQMMKRFPVTAGATVVTTGLSLYLIEMDKIHPQSILDLPMKVVMMLALSLPLFLTSSLVGERFGLKKWQTYAVQAGVAAILAVYYFSLPPKLSAFTSNDDIRYALLQVISYLLLLIAPWFPKKDTHAEWNYSENLFVRLFITGVFSATLFAGLALSLWSIDYLFGVHWKGQTYFEIWLVIVGIFATWFYLSTFPALKEYYIKREVPSVLRIFVSYILVPLLSLFYVILYTYVGKILITWNWPMGGVATWVLAFSIVGVLSYLVGYMLQKEVKWLKKFFQIFFILIIPLAIVLFMAVGMRIEEYGLTVNRYLVVLFGVWLILVALYYLLSKEKQIKVAPALTAVFFFLSIFGPWNMFHLSDRSQFAKLEKLLTDNKILVDGKIQKISEKEIDPKVADNIRSKTEYVIGHGGYEKIQPWFDENLKVHSSDFGGSGEVYNYEISQNAFRAMGIENVYYRPAVQVNENNFNFYQNKDNPVISTENYQYVISNFGLYNYASDNPPAVSSFTLGNRKVSASLKGNTVKIFEGENVLLEMNLDAKVKELKQKYDANFSGTIDEKDLSIVQENQKIKVKILLSRISGEVQDGTNHVRDLGGVLLISLQ